MRFLHELAVSYSMFGIAFVILFGIALAVGTPFGLEGRTAAVLAAAFLCICVPAFANVYIAVKASGGESRRQRVCAAVRAFGFLFCAVAPMVVPRSSWDFPLFFAALGLTFGTLLFDGRRQTELGNSDNPGDNQTAERTPA